MANAILISGKSVELIKFIELEILSFKTIDLTMPLMQIEISDKCVEFIELKMFSFEREHKNDRKFVY